jgi:hypothetical protein
VGHEGAVRAWDRGWGAAVVDDDGGQGWRRDSGEGLSSGEEDVVD